MSNYGELIAKDVVRFKRILPGPIEKVWAFLVEPNKRAKWLAGGQMELKTGGRVELIFNNASLSRLEDVPPADKYKDMPDCPRFEGRVTQFSAPYKLSFTWAGESDFTEVDFELTELDNKVLLVVTHKKLSEKEFLLGAMAGWHTHLEILAAVLLEQEPQPFWQQHKHYEKEYSRRLS